MSSGAYQELARELVGLAQDGIFIKGRMTARLGDGTDAGSVVVAPADRQYPTFPLFWCYTETNGTKDVFQAVPWYPGLTYDDSQRHMEVVLVQFPQLDPKLWFIFSFSEIGLAAWGGATPMQVGLQQAAAVTPDKILLNSVYFVSGMTVGFRGGSLRIDDNWYTLDANASFADLTAYIPATADKQRWVSLSIDSAGTAGITQSDEFNSSETDKLNFIPNTIPAGGYGQLQPILLTNGMTEGSNDLILPYRDMFYAPGAADSETILTSPYLNTPTISGGTIAGATITVKDANLTIQDDGDTTKQLQLQLSGLTTATTVVLSPPPASDTITGIAATQTLTNKTLTSPVISGGTINNAVIGGTTPAAGTFTTLQANTSAVLIAGAAGTVPLKARGAASQTANLQEWQDSASTVLASINSTGELTSPRGLFSQNTAATTTQAEVLTLVHNSTGTPAAGFGTNVVLRGESSTTTNQLMAVWSTAWVTATHASRAARFQLYIYDTAAREGLRVEASGTAPMIGFLGASAIARYSTTGTTTGFTQNVGTEVRDDSSFTGNTGATAYTIGDVVRALKQYGLLAS